MALPDPIRREDTFGGGEERARCHRHVRRGGGYHPGVERVPVDLNPSGIGVPVDASRRNI